MLLHTPWYKAYWFPHQLTPQVYPLGIPKITLSILYQRPAVILSLPVSPPIHFTDLSLDDPKIRLGTHHPSLHIRSSLPAPPPTCSTSLSLEDPKIQIGHTPPLPPHET